VSLTAKQQRFVEEYLIDLNATQAAIRAGYSPETAKQQGSRLLTNADIHAAVNRYRAASAERTELTVASITTRLLTIADKGEKLAEAPGLSVARAALMDAAKLNGLVVDTVETVKRTPEERAARLAHLKAERERIARPH
jgi:phage terminase small subunit